MSFDSKPSIRLADVRWLATEEGAEALRRADCEETEVGGLVHLSRLRREFGAHRATVLAQQIGLRRRARHRFPRADEMLWTPQALEQASSWQVASYKASRFARAEAIVDLCCGAGSDFVAFGGRAPCTGYDIDAVCAYLANYHSQRFACGNAVAEQADVCRIPIPRDAAVHIDPDRRARGRRSIQLEHHQPSIEFLRTLASHPGGVAIKLAPATDPNHPLLAEAQLEWVGQARDCQQLIAWFGPLAEPAATRQATVLSHHAPPSIYFGDPAPTQTPLWQPDRKTYGVGHYLAEPHAPILAAGLGHHLANEYRLVPLTRGGGYLTGDHIEPTPWWQVFKVMDVAPFREKRLTKWLACHDIGSLEVKKRGVRCDPLSLQRRFGRRDGPPATLLIFSQGQRRIAVLARRSS